jgi:hypothetical protein
MDNPAPKDDEFDNFLAESVKKEEQKTDGELFHLQLDEQMRSVLLHYGIYSLTDTNESRSQENIAMTIDAYIAVNEERIREQYGGQFTTEAEFQDFLNAEANHVVKMEALLEAFILTSVSLIMASHEYGVRNALSTTELYQAEADISELKKQLIAQLIVDGKIDARSEWVRFINDFIPGEVFDPAGEEAGAYLVAALEAYTQKAEQQGRNHETMMQVFTILQNVPEPWQDESKVWKVTSELLLTAITKTKPSQRDAAIDGIARTRGINEDTLKAIKDILQEMYPLETDQ